MRFVSACLDEKSDWTMTELCETFGVSRKTGYKWLERYAVLGLDGLKDQSRAPQDHPNQVSEAVVEKLLQMRRSHRT